MGAAQLAAWRQAVADGFEAEWAAAQAGAYRESAKEFLSSSWQGDALTVRGTWLTNQSFYDRSATPLGVQGAQQQGPAKKASHAPPLPGGFPPCLAAEPPARPARSTWCRGA